MIKEDPLTMECRYLSKLIFRVEPRDEIINAYQKAHQVIFASYDLTILNGFVAQAIARQSDLEAVEYALRRANQSNILTKKVHTLFYLIETRSESFSLFINDKDAILTAYLSMAFHTFRSIYKWIKGKLMLRTGLFKAISSAAKNV